MNHRVTELLAWIEALFVLVITSVPLLLSSCGGGGGGGGTSPPAVFREDLLYGYYGENAVAEVTANKHTNLVFAADFYGPAEQMATLTQAMQQGKKVVLMVPSYPVDPAQTEGEIRSWLERLKGAGLLWDGIVAIYPIDEPNNEANHKSDAEITATNAIWRKVLKEYPPIAGAKLAVIYAAGRDGMPGLSSYDLVGGDDYDKRCDVLSSWYVNLKRKLRPDQKMLVVPGGASDWKQDPTCFVNFAENDPQVWAVIPWILQDGDGHQGIMNNGMLPQYCKAGWQIVAPGQPPSC